MRRERIASVVTALALVLAAVGGGLGPMSATQNASAEWVDCSLSDPLTGAAYNTIIGADTGCRWESGDQKDYENITQTDGYASALSVKDNVDSYFTTTNNFLQNARAIAYQKAKIEVVQGLENGTTESVVKNDANQTAQDYYTRVDRDALDAHNAWMSQLLYLDTSQNVTVETDGTPVGGWYRANVTLKNGTTMRVMGVESLPGKSTDGVKIPGYSINGEASNIEKYNESTDSWEDASGTTIEYINDADVLAVDDPDTGNPATVYNLTRIADSNVGLLGDTDSQYVQVRDNMNQYVDGVYQQYNAGELNATTIVQNDPSLLASEATTSFNSTGYYGYASAQLASIGYAGDLNQSHVVEVGGANYTGTLFFSGEDGTTFNTGETYDFANVSGAVYMAVSDGPNNVSGIVRLDDRGSSFTILEATNTQTGESVNATTPQPYIYESADASNLEQEISRLADLREFYENQAAGGGGGFGDTPSTYVAVGLALVLLGALFAGRS